MATLSRSIHRALLLFTRVACTIRVNRMTVNGLGNFADGHVIEVGGSLTTPVEEANLDTRDCGGKEHGNLPPCARAFSKLEIRDLGYHAVADGVDDTDAERPQTRGADTSKSLAVFSCAVEDSWA